MATARYVEFDPLLDPDQLAALRGIVDRHAPYPTYAEGRRQEGFGAGIPQRYDALRNFLTGRAGQDPVWKVASRTNYFRDTFAYEEPLFPEIAFFQQLPQLIEASRYVTGRNVVRPAIVYLNVLVPGQELAMHTDVPEFRGANRTREPEWLLVAMHHSGLFERWRRHIATGVSWYHDCAGGEFTFFPDGPDASPRRLAVRENTAILLDTDSVFHGIDPLALRAVELPRIEPGARLHRDPDGRWSVHAGDEVRATYDWSELRLSISWKAWCFADEAEARVNDEHGDDLALPFILDTLTADLIRRGRIASRPDDERLARVILEEYIQFPD